jgi:peroxiredoxin
MLRAASDPASELRISSQQHPLLDQPAPLFTLLDSDGLAWSLDEKLERGPVVLVFYLNYGCDVCVSGLFELNADIRMFQALGAELVAISDDPPELTQRRFKRYGAFSFPVLSDAGHVVATTYSIFHPANADEPEQLLHGTFVIGQDRQVKWAHTGDAPFTPNTALLCELAQCKRELSQERKIRVDFTTREGR